ncbi:MAG: nitrate reductase [Spirochaetia bacterium]|nr:nitrate reductase [Spirochaetia bacterium]
MNLKNLFGRLRKWEGPLTKDLLLRPGDFGLGKIPAKFKPDSTTTMVCGFCSTGCGLNVHLKEGRAVNLSPSTEYPVNLGMACPKGWEALTPLKAHDRGLTPLLRDKSGKIRKVDWKRAVSVFTERFKDIAARHGSESIAWIGTGQIASEELALLGALGKVGMGMVHGDGNTRQCMATAATAYKQSFGFDAPPFSYQDFEESDVIVLVGSNLCIAHPIMWQRVLRNRNQPEIIVVDPRKTETAMAATRHLAIRPKSDLALLYGIANRIIAAGGVKAEFINKSTLGFEEFSAFIKVFKPEKVSEATGLGAEEIQKISDIILRGKKVSFWWTMGVNQGHEATRTAQAIVNLALMTGNIGRPGTGANSITGQCNAMGSRLFSNSTNLLGGRDFEKAEHREKVAQILGIDAVKIPTRNSWAYDQILQGIDDGKIKGLWVIATNTAHSWIDQERLKSRFDKLDFLVVQDMYPTTETAAHADLILPAAGWGEKEGTFINSERRIGLLKKVSEAPGLALSDFNIFKLIAEAYGVGEMFSRWSSPEAVFQILKELSAGQPCDITGIRDYRMIDECGGIQWPLVKRGDTQEAPVQERRLFEDGVFFHPDGKAKFLFEAPREVAEPTSGEYPFTLLTGRGTSSQWHTQSRTSKSDVLRKLYPENIYVEINPEDARRLEVEPQMLLRVASRRGALSARAVVTPTVQPGQIFIPMHYPETNRLTFPSFDPYSRQPSYKACAVSVAILAKI